jgi:hypothetical protein
MRTSIFIVILFSGILTYARDTNSQRCLEIGFGAHHLSLYDQIFSPLIYRGTGSLFDVGYRHQTTNWLHDLSISYASQSLKPKLNLHATGRVENLNLSFEYTVSRRFPSSLQHHLGIGLYHFMSARTFIFLIDDEISIDLFSSLNVTYAYNQTFFDRHHINVKTSFPLLAYVVGRMRVPNDFSEEVFQSIVEDPFKIPFGKMLKSGGFLTFNSFFDLRIKLSYLYDLSQKIGVGLRYDFQFYTYPKFENVQFGASQYKIQLAYKF